MINDLLVAPSARPNPVESFVGILTPIPPNFPASNSSDCVHRHRYYCNAYRNLISIMIASWMGCTKNYRITSRFAAANVLWYYRLHPCSSLLFTALRICGVDVPESPILSPKYLIIQPQPTQCERVRVSIQFVVAFHINYSNNCGTLNGETMIGSFKYLLCSTFVSRESDSPKRKATFPMISFPKRCLFVFIAYFIWHNRRVDVFSPVFCEPAQNKHTHNTIQSYQSALYSRNVLVWQFSRRLSAARWQFTS